MSDYCVHITLTKKHNVDQRVLRRNEREFNTFNEAVWYYDKLLKTGVV